VLVSKSGFEPRGTESRRSTTPSHGNMRLRLSSTETLKRVLVVPPTKIMFYYCVVTCFWNPKQKKRRNSPTQVKTPVLEPPVSVLSKRLFLHSSFAMREERYKNRFVSIKQKESKRMNEKSGTFTKRAALFIPRIGANREMQFSSSYSPRARASKEKKTRAKNISQFSLSS